MSSPSSLNTHRVPVCLPLVQVIQKMVRTRKESMERAAAAAATAAAAASEAASRAAEAEAEASVARKLAAETEAPASAAAAAKADAIAAAAAAEASAAEAAAEAAAAAAAATRSDAAEPKKVGRTESQFKKAKLQHLAATHRFDDTRLVEIRLIHAATVVQNATRQVEKIEKMRGMAGYLFKRSSDVPLFQKRWFFMQVGDFLIIRLDLAT